MTIEADIVAILQETPGLSAAAISERLGILNRTVNVVLAGMERDGTLTKKVELKVPRKPRGHMLHYVYFANPSPSSPA